MSLVSAFRPPARPAGRAWAIFAAARWPVKPSSRAAVALLCVLAAAACSGSPPPGVYRADSDAPLGLELAAARGVRDGDRMTARLEFRGENADVLQIDLQLAIGVPTRLRQGSWIRTSAAGEERGSVHARSLTFLGGQSDWPNLGGSLELRDSTGVRYRVRFAPTEVVP